MRPDVFEALGSVRRMPITAKSVGLASATGVKIAVGRTVGPLSR